MKKFTVRIVSAIVSVCLAAAMLAGCNPKSEGNNYIEMNGKKISIPYAFKIGGKEVSMEEYRYYFLNLKHNYFDYGDESYWEKHPEDEQALKNQVINYCKSNAAAVLLAEKYNLTISEDEQAFIDSQIESNKANYETQAEYEQWLAGQYCTEDFYIKRVTESYLQRKLLDFMFGENGPEYIEDEDKTIKENFVHAQHILIADKDSAQNVLDRVNAGEDFVTLMKEFNEDPGESEDGYTFTKGEMVAAFEEAAFALSENAVSGLVQTDYGYHIIKRLPLEQSYIDENKEDMISNYKSMIMYQELDEFMAELEVENSKYYDDFGIDTILDNTSSEAAAPAAS